MRRMLSFVALPLSLLACSQAWAYYPSEESHFANRPADAHKTNTIEGWINRIDTVNSQVVVMDAQGVEKRIWLKPTIIGEYRIKDKVRIKTWPGTREANTIEKIKV